MRIPGTRLFGSLCIAGLLMATQLAACSDMGTQDVWMSPDASGARRRTIFTTDSENINIIVQYSTGRRDLTIRAEIFPVEIAEDSKFQTFIPEAPLEALANTDVGAIQAFSLTRVPGETLPALPGNTQDDVIEGQPIEPWPVGDFRARILFDDEEVGLVGFRIVWAECPTSPPVQNAACRQFKTNGTCTYNEGTAAVTKCDCAQPIQELKWQCTVNDKPPPGPVPPI